MVLYTMYFKISLLTFPISGHNWGSFHDPNTVECNPSTAAGKYLMYEFAQSGIAPNNMVSAG